MKTLISMYMHALHQEKDAFWDYLELMDHETHKDHKSIWYAIATDELQHFAKIKDTIWGEKEGRTEMEQAICEEYHEQYEHMKKALEKRK